MPRCTKRRKKWQKLATTLDDIDRQEFDFDGSNAGMLARDAWKKAVAIDPKLLSAWVGLAQHYADCNLPNERADCLRQILAFSPHHMPSLAELGILMYQRSFTMTDDFGILKKSASPTELKQVKRQFEAAIGVNPTVSRRLGVYVFLANLFAASGNQRAAQRLIDQHLALKPSRGDEFSPSQVQNYRATVLGTG